MYDVQDWAKVHRLHHRERWSKTAIAEKLGMSRNTVDRPAAENDQVEGPCHRAETARRGSDGRLGYCRSLRDAYPDG